MKIIALTNTAAGLRYKTQMQKMFDAGAEVIIIDISGNMLTFQRIIRNLKLVKKNGITWFIKRRKNISQLGDYVSQSLEIEDEAIKKLDIPITKGVDKHFPGFTSSLINFIKKETPDYIFQTGVGIIPDKIIDIGIPILNFHPGILPGIRGVSPTFWALYYKKYEWLGTTLHYIDYGIDTGKPIVRKRIEKDDLINHHSGYMYWIVKNECEILGKLITEGVEKLEDDGGEVKNRYKSYWTKEQYEKLYINK